MPVYDVMVRQGAKIATAPVVAGSTGEARLIAGKMGTVMGEPKARKDSSRGGMSVGERYVFLYQLATMNTAKVPLSMALKVLREQHGGRIARAAAGLEAGVASGRQIADLMYEDKRNFPGAVGLLVKAGSKGQGGTASALKKAADFERQILGAATKGAKGLYSAGFWISAATISILACPLWMTPYLKNSTLFKLTKQPSNWDWLDNTSYAVGAITASLMLVGLSIFFVVGVGQRLFPQISDAIVMKLPYVKDIVFTRDNFVSLYRFSLMVKAGVTLEEALDTTWRDTRKGALKDDLARALNNVKTGRPWAEGFRTVDATDRIALSMATDKERLGEILEQVADQNRAVYIRRLEVLQPIMQVIGGLSMVLVYGITGLYSIVPFSDLFGKLMGDASGF
jgi:general secretion pathway protein F